MSLHSNQRGLSLTEMLIAVGVSGLLALGGMQLMKSLSTNQAGFTTKMESQDTAKLIEQGLNGPGGCANVLNKKVGAEISVKLGGSTLARGSTFNKLTVDSLKIDKFFPTDESGLTGMAEIQLVLSGKQGLRPVTNKVLLAVNVTKEGNQAPVIVSCNAGRQKSLNQLVDRLCQGTYGANTPDLSCAQVIQFLQKITSRSICKDLYGDAAAMRMRDQYCDLSEVHKNKQCPMGKILAGFDPNGGLICRDRPDPNAANLCRGWSTFAPDERTSCPEVLVYQTRTCLSPQGVDASESRTISGTKATGCDQSRRCRPPGSWKSEEGLTCIADDPNESFLTTGEQTHRVTGKFGPYVVDGESFRNTGTVTFVCEDGDARIVSSDCTQGAMASAGN